MGCDQMNVSRVVSILFMGVILSLASCSKQPAPTTSSTSPDGRFRLELVEIARRGIPADRNFDIVLIDLAADDARQILFSSPDEGHPVGTEAFIWNQASTVALLAGRHFYLDERHAIKGRDGRTAYLLLDLESMKIRCNASQVELDRFSETDLEAAGFGGWLPGSDMEGEKGKPSAG